MVEGLIDYFKVVERRQSGEEISLSWKTKQAIARMGRSEVHSRRHTFMLPRMEAVPANRVDAGLSIFRAEGQARS